MIASGVPIIIGADDARRAAQRELSKHIYHTQDPSLLERAADRFRSWLGNLLDHAAAASPGGATGLVLIVVAVVAVIVALRLGLGPLARTAQATSAVFEERHLTAADYRANADACAADGDYAGAVRERFRAVVRELEERGVLERRPEQTADEAATEAGGVLTALAADLRSAARAFDDVTYGGRQATTETDASIRSLDQHVRAARIHLPV
jgi:hypothetical protein